jgi:phage virion morphogenesis protein
MSDTEITLVVRDDISRVLAQLSAAAADLTQPMKQLSAELETSTVARFDSNIGPDGVPWEPSQRALGYTSQKRGGKSANAFGKTLVESGDLRSSITSDWGRDFLTIGVEASFGAGIYAVIHQFGGQAGRNKSVTLPARPYLGLSDSDNDMILDILSQHLGQPLAGALA